MFSSDMWNTPIKVWGTEPHLAWLFPHDENDTTGKWRHHRQKQLHILAEQQCQPREPQQRHRWHILI